MKVFVCLLAIVSVCSASVIGHAHVAVAAPALLSTGSSTQSRTQDAAGNYAFAYNEQHSTGGSSRSESGAPGVATGSYTLNVADGRQRVVNYVADAAGFRAAIATNEPGTAALPAANTAISSPYAAPLPVAPVHPEVPVHAPAVVHAAPAVVEPVVHAPLVHAAPALAVAAPVHHAHLAVHHVPAISSYSTSVNHAFAAPVVHAAPALAVAAPVHHAHLAAPLLHHYRK